MMMITMSDLDGDDNTDADASERLRADPGTLRNSYLRTIDSAVGAHGCGCSWREW